MSKSPVVTIRVPAERLERINSRAKAAGLTRTQYVLDRADPEGRTERLTTPQDMTRPTVACVHPRVDRQVFGWGTICGQCGVKLL